MMIKSFLAGTALLVALTGVSLPVHAKTSLTDVVTNYAALVYANYTDAYKDALLLQLSIDAFLSDPNEQNLTKAKQAWLVSRNSYGQTEAFRFYEGPIDDSNGPEGRLNAWPLNEAYIDYVQGDTQAGIVQKSDTAITKETLSEKNQLQDEADVSTGYHAIEFLLWGQDLSLETAGTRPASNYDNNDTNIRRRDYLKAVTELLIDDLKYLVKSWQPDVDNYAASFVKNAHAPAHILTGLATLSGFEVASERLATALDSGDQEDEHSCFSDNTHNDFIMNAKGVENVYYGTYSTIKGASLHDVLREENSVLAEKLSKQLQETAVLLAALPFPVDRELLAAQEGSPARKIAEKAVISLQKQADLFKQAGMVLGLDVSISGD